MHTTYWLGLIQLDHDTISKNGLSEHDPFDHPTTCLVVEPTPLKNMKVSWDDYSQYMEK